MLSTSIIPINLIWQRCLVVKPLVYQTVAWGNLKMFLSNLKKWEKCSKLSDKFPSTQQRRAFHFLRCLILQVSRSWQFICVFSYKYVPVSKLL